ncbi:MAG: sugar phosphate nucleotidyltransferase [Fimbriimonadales bacterium]|nr:sugar phosphate nucleotidyltransferase [Fimbriimonadales bacterium]
MKGVILAAGKGTRLFPVTYHIPKPLLPLANRLTLEYAFDRLREIDVRDICIVVGENEPQMRSALGDGARFGLNLSYVRQTHPQGLAHAVGFAREFVGDEPFVLYLGDALYSKGFHEHARRFLESGCANLNLVQWVEDPRRYGVANLDGERIVKLVEKPKNPDSNWAMAGLYFFRPPIWEVLPDLKPSARGEYEITDTIQLLIDRGHTVLAGVYDGVWYDTGTLESFLEVSRFLINGGQIIDPTARVKAQVGEAVVIGAGATVECAFIEDSVILPGARIKIDGEIRRCLLGGTVFSEDPLTDAILYEG